MEPQIAEFVAYACFIAQRKYSQPIPQGVLEKMVDLTVNIFSVPIEFVSIRSDIFGHVTSLELGTADSAAGFPFVYRPPSGTLYTLTSKYLSIKNVGGERLFSATEAFEKELPLIIQKPHIPVFESVIEEALALWQADAGGLSNLVFCTLACYADGGVSQVIADAEIILAELRVYVRDKFYLKKEPSSAVKKQRLDRIRAAAAAARKKVYMLSVPAPYLGRLGTRFTALGMRLQTKVKQFPAECHLWKMWRWLIAELERIAVEFVNVSTDEEPASRQLDLLDQENKPKTDVSLISLVRDVEAFNARTYRKLTLSGQFDVAASIVELFMLFQANLELWIRALGVISDEEFFRMHSADDDPMIGGKRHAVAFDLEDSFRMIAEAIKTARTTELNGLKQCRADLGAIPRNWAILFGGKLGPRQGDKDIAFFERPGQALDALAFSLAHVDALRNSGRWAFSPYIRSGIGTGEVIVLDGQAQTLELSAAFKAISSCADVDRDRGIALCSAVALEDFLIDNPTVEQFRGEESFRIGDFNALRLKWDAYMNKVIARFDKGLE